MSKYLIIILGGIIFFTTSTFAQEKHDSILTNASLEQCVQYALQHQPDVNKALMDERIVNAEVKSRLADWYPQLGFDYTLQHYFKIPVSIINGTPVATAQTNFSTTYFSATQNIFNRDVLLASQSAKNVRTQAKQI